MRRPGFVRRIARRGSVRPWPIGLRKAMKTAQSSSRGLGALCGDEKRGGSMPPKSRIPSLQSNSAVSASSAVNLSHCCTSTYMLSPGPFRASPTLKKRAERGHFRRKKPISSRLPTAQRAATITPPPYIRPSAMLKSENSANALPNLLMNAPPRDVNHCQTTTYAPSPSQFAPQLCVTKRAQKTHFSTQKSHFTRLHCPGLARVQPRRNGASAAWCRSLHPSSFRLHPWTSSPNLEATRRSSGFGDLRGEPGPYRVGAKGSPVSREKTGTSTASHHRGSGFLGGGILFGTQATLSVCTVGSCVSGFRARGSAQRRSNGVSPGAGSTLHDHCCLETRRESQVGREKVANPLGRPVETTYALGSSDLR